MEPRSRRAAYVAGAVLALTGAGLTVLAALPARARLHVIEQGGTASAAGDAVDGRLARRLGVASGAGGWADATADLLVAAAAFVAFVRRGLFPGWLVGLIVLMFAQFVATSALAAWRPGHRLVARPVYDPVGRYFGAALFGAAGVTLVAPASARSTVPVAIASLAMVSLGARLVYLLAGRREATRG